MIWPSCCCNPWRSRQRVEITSYTDTSGLEFEIDDPLVDLAELRIDFGGVTDIGNLELDNLLGPVNPATRTSRATMISAR